MDRLAGFISRRSLSTLLILSTICVTTPAILLVIYLGNAQFNARQEATAGQAMEFARRFAMKHEDVLLHARTLLKTLATNTELTSTNQEQLRKRFVQLMADNPQYAYLTLVGLDGNLQTSSSSTDISINFSDREVYKAALAGNSFSVGQAIISRTTGLPVLPFATPIRDESGNISSVLLLGYKVDEYNAFFSTLGLPANGGRVILFDPQGRRLLRYPADERLPLGEQLTHWKQVADSQRDFDSFIATGPEGLELMYAFIKHVAEPSSPDNLGVLVAVPRTSFLKLFWPVFGQTILLIAATALAPLAINLYLFRKILLSGLSSIAKSFQYVTRGEFREEEASFAGCREVIALGQEFTSMAKALAQAKTAQDAAEAALVAEADQLKALLDSAIDGIHVLDENGNLVLCGPSFAAMLGYELDEAARLNVVDWDADLKPGESVASVRRFMLCPGRYQTRHRRKDGTVFDVEVNSRRVSVDGKSLLFSSSHDITARKRAEDALRDLEKSHRELIQKAPLGIFKVSPEGQFLSVNPWLARWYGAADVKEFLRCVHNSELHLYTNPEDRRELLEAAASGMADGMEQCRRRGDGSIGWMSISMRLVRDDKGGILHYEGFARDITSRIEANERLGKERARLAAILEGTDVGTWEWNVQTGETIFNERWAEIVGYTLEELAPVSIKTWEALAHPEDLEMSNSLIALHFSGKLPHYDIECRMRHKAGHWVWVHDRGRLFTRDSMGAPLLMYGTHEDITGRKASEDKLRESEERYRATFEGMEAIRLVIDPADGSIEDANSAAVKFYGYPLATLKQMNISDINILPREKLWSELAKAAAAEKSTFNFQHRLASGEIRDVEVHVSNLRILGEKRVVSTIHDITEVKRLGQIKEDVERIIRHDLKSPLNGIINIPLVLLGDANLTASQQDMLKLVVAAGQKMLSQLNCAQIMHKIEAGEYKSSPHETDVMALIINNIAILTRCYGLAPSIFKVSDAEGGCGPLLIQSDSALLDVALMNLLSNALEARLPEEELRVTCHVRPGECSIEISNRHPVPLEVRDSFFDKYSTFGKAGGTGLGTYSSRILIRALNGDIALRSSEEDGTVVTIRLPMAT